MLAYAEVCARFGAGKQVGRHWRVRCPAHDDQQASLDIDEGAEGRSLFVCRAGCTIEAILTASSLTWADIQPDRGPLPDQWDHVHAYQNVLRQTLYEVCRRGTGPGKIVRQRRPNGAGGYVWTLGDVPRVPYHLPELQGQARVYVVEGELKVEALERAGFVSTCNTGGAGGWKASDSAYLNDAGVHEVIILPDHDAPGAKHAIGVRASCEQAGIAARIVELPGLAPKGDIVNWFAAGHTAAELEQLVAQGTNGHGPTLARVPVLTYAADITLKPVRWLWQDRLPQGSVCLLAGREGIGKSLLAYTLAAAMTKGRLPGQHEGHPATVIAIATEDSWAHTIAPRLILAQADLTRIARLEMRLPDGASLPPELPIDLAALEQVIGETHASLVILDPLLSRIGGKLDSHKDAEVRIALEPLTAMAERTGTTILGLIHLNKSTTSDMLTQVMGSRAFVAVARAVLGVITDSADPTRRLMGQPKNNLGRTDLPVLTYTIDQGFAGSTPDGDIYSAVLVWGADSTQTFADAFASAQEMASGDTTATAEAADWLLDYLQQQPDQRADSAPLKKAAAQAGHAARTLHRARIKLRVLTHSLGYPRRTYWSLPPTSIPREIETDTANF